VCPFPWPPVRIRSNAAACWTCTGNGGPAASPARSIMRAIPIAAEGLAALVDEDIGGLDPVSPLLQFSAPGNSRHQNEPAPYFTSCYLLVGRGPLGERNRPIDHWWSECAILKEWRECLKHGCGFGRVAFAGVDAKQLPLIVVKVAKVEADTTIAYRCNFDLPPAMS
jgi:hypothetical protein